MDFITALLILSSYDFIFVIINYFNKMIHFALYIKIITNEEKTNFFDNIYLYHKLLKDIILNKEI